MDNNQNGVVDGPLIEAKSKLAVIKNDKYVDWKTTPVTLTDLSNLSFNFQSYRNTIST